MTAGAPPRPVRHPWNTTFEWVDHTGTPGTLTPEQVAAFDHDGYLVLPAVLGADEVAAADAAIAPGVALVAGLLEQLPGGRISVAGLDTQVVAPHLVTTSPVLRDLCAHPTLAGACADLVGPDVRLYWEQAVYKQPHGAEPVLWHQDNGYTFVEPQAYLTCWIALSDATPDNGCISVVPGWHRHGTLAHRETDLGFECDVDAEAAVDVPARAGDVVVFSSLTPHATRANGTDEVRRAYIVQYAHDGAVGRTGDPDGPGTEVRLDDPERQFPVVSGGRPVAAPPLDPPAR